MNQIIKFYILISTFLVILFLYLYDSKRLSQEKNNIYTKINNIEIKLEENRDILDAINNVKNNFDQRKKMLESYQISGPELMEELEKLNTIANQLGLLLSNVEIDPQNTFPNFDYVNEENSLNLERHSLRFRLNGKFLNIGRFMDRVGSSNTQLKVQYCSFQLDSLDPKGVVADLEYLTYAASKS